MLIKIGDFEFTEVWDGVFYKKLSCYPAISDWEKRNIIEFVEYETSHGRKCQIECENADVLAEVNQALQNRETYRHSPRPPLITECTACPVRKGCVTEFVCHTTSIENAKKILACGNCQAGDRLVMERKLGRFPDEKDLSVDFTPGIRFYFRYDDLTKHPGCTFDGVLPMKIKDEIFLRDWLYSMVVPEELRDTIDSVIPEELADRVVYITNDCLDIWDWSEKVYGTIEKR